jgi:DNA-damage-inducible protein D
MKRELIVKLHADFEELVHKEEDIGVEFWLARDLQNVLGYARWENFSKVIYKAKIACNNSNQDIKDHFLDVTKMVLLGSGAEREIF